MDKIWLASYPNGVSQTIDIGIYRSLGELFERSAAHFADSTAYVNMDRGMTYAELERLSRALAAYFQSELKLVPGARVALMMPNSLQYPVALFAVLRAGYAVVNCNPLYTSRELQHQLKDSGAEVIVIIENFAWVLAEVVASTRVKHVIVTKLGDLLGFPKGSLVNFVVKFVKKTVRPWHIPGAIRFPAVLARGEALEFEPVEIGHDDVAFLQYTGGTTGVPKGAILTHGNMLANVLQSLAWVKPFAKQGEEVIRVGTI